MATARTIGYWTATSIIGFAMLSGGVALLVPRLPLLKEWAYAGVFFDLSGATTSHAFAGDNAMHIISPLILISFTVASWLLRPQARTLRGSEQ